MSEDCALLGIPVCFPLTNFKSLPLGKLEEQNGRQYITDTTKGVFLSFQSKEVNWGVGDASAPFSEVVNATAGAFMNLPTGSVNINLHEVYNGIPQVRTEFIDRGVGLF